MDKDENKPSEAENKPSEAESAIAEMYKQLQEKYDNEHKLRTKAEADVVSLTKIIRTMEIKPAEEEKPESLDDLTKKLFK